MQQTVIHQNKDESLNCSLQGKWLSCSFFKDMFHRAFGNKNRIAPKKPPLILQQSEHGINPTLLSSNARRVVSILEDAGYEAYVVGGAVRDLLLGISPKDFDVATNATPEQVRRLFRRAFVIGRRFQIVHVMFGRDLIEVTTFRKENTTTAFKDETGRLLRDNTFGSLEEDALRRDFTINAMYYNPTLETLYDFHGGIADLDNKVLRIIGDPAERYREDPVRMLRSIRFASKLGFTIDPATKKPIQTLAHLLENIPSARIFDETLKLLTSGHALACLTELRSQGLQHGHLPLLDVVQEQPQATLFAELVLEKIDTRIREEKMVSPTFLFAALLWTQVAQKWQQYRSQGEHPHPALISAANVVLDTQAEKLALHRRITSGMRDIWSLQPRFERRTGKVAHSLVEHSRFKAAYDFLLLRCEAGEIDPEVAQWWGAFKNADRRAREEMLKVKPKSEAAPAKRKKKRSRRSARAAAPQD